MSEFLGLHNDTFLLAFVAESLVIACGLAAFSWFGGRDRWLGDYPASIDGEGPQRIKPLFSHETVLPEYEPPLVSGKGHVLRPAEMGVVLNERAGSAEISATIIDLAGRRHIRFKENQKRDDDIDIVKLESPEDDTLLPFERRFLSALFEDDVVRVSERDGASTVQLKDLNGAFWVEMSALKAAVYQDVVDVDGLFKANPEQARNGMASAVSPTFALLASLSVLALGVNYHAAILGIPFVLGSVALFFAGRAQPRRTGLGREMLRRSKGFLLFLSTTDPIEMRFDDEKGLVDRFLPYAMVFGCARNWTARFEHLDRVDEMPDWWVSSGIRTTLLGAAAQAIADHFSGVRASDQPPQ